jgi:hypothetical protein
MVHVPEAGKPCNCTLPVATVQVGCVIGPIIGAVGADGSVRFTGPAMVLDWHPAALVTSKLVYEAAERFRIVITPEALLVRLFGLTGTPFLL